MSKGKAVAVAVSVSVAFLAWLVLGHGEALAAVAGRAQWRYLWAALACSAASYAMVGLALWEVLGLLGFPLSFPAVLGIAFVSNTANYFVSSVGVSGFALKAHLLRKRLVPYGTTVTASVVTSAMVYFVLALIIAQGVGYLLLRAQGTRIQLMEGILGLGAVLAMAGGMLAFFFDREIRGRISQVVFRWVNQAAFLFSAREIPREDFAAFEAQLEEGLARIHADQRRLRRAILYTVLDWGFMMLVLHFGFLAVGTRLPIGHLCTGFAVGQAATLIPLLPGGLGAMEGGMAATFAGFGVGWEEAMLAALLFRFAYYLVPGLCSVFLLWGLKVSEPALIEDTVSDTLPGELKLKAENLERGLARRRTEAP